MFTDKRYGDLTGIVAPIVWKTTLDTNLVICEQNLICFVILYALCKLYSILSFYFHELNSIPFFNFSIVKKKCSFGQVGLNLW